MTNKKNKRLITVNSSGPLPELGHILGPVLHPWFVDTETVTRLVANGRNVIEVNPDNRTERVALTLKNVRLNNFSVTTPKVETPVKPYTPVKPEQPKEVVVPEKVIPVVDQNKESDFKKK